MKTYYGIVFQILGLLFVLNQSAMGQNSDTVLTAGMDAPKFYLRDLKNNEFYSSDFYGEPRKTYNAPQARFPVVISFFATWCIPCRKEIPELDRLQKKYPQIKFFLIDVAENEEIVTNYLKTNPTDLPILLDKFGKIAEKFKVQKPGTKLAVLPTLAIIRPDGKIHYYKKGYTEGDELIIEQELIKMIQ